MAARMDTPSQSSLARLRLTFIFILVQYVFSTYGEALDFDEAPGIAMEYRVHVDAGKEDCYYQYVHPGASLYISLWVVRGGDGMAGFAVRHPKGHHVQPYQWKSETEYEEEKSEGGFYELCIDNQFSRFADKLVNLYLTTFRQVPGPNSHDKWEKYTQDLQALDVDVANFTNMIHGVDQRIQSMSKYQQMARNTESRDMGLIQSNQSYVQYWSLTQCIVVLATGTVQVLFLRKLFETGNT
ncbi:unnamed protein product, partial [Darwinula stevensoni]